MKRVLGVIMSLVLLAGAALPAAAQTRSRYPSRVAQTRRYGDARRAYYDRRYDDRYDRRDERSFWEEHRDKVTVAAGAGAGAVVGAAAGGKKGAIIGALVGAGASALYTYGARDRDNNDRRYRR
ncbi:MAG TPA: hypothetical protein VM864_12870 [Pyrinomonadaceae bacterium]|jgi:hypothetical protein|nr:hypothetical protein [Pyrinomonadaceae bacterium]